MVGRASGLGGPPDGGDSAGLDAPAAAHLVDPAVAEVAVDVLGLVRARVGDRALELAPKQRVLVGALVLAGAPLGTDELASRLWAEPPRTAAKAVHNQVARLRRALGEAALRTEGGGYVLAGAVEVDAVVFEHRVEQAAAQLVPAPERCCQHLDLALERWRGEPYLDLDLPEAAAERARLLELRAGAEELDAEARLLAGDLSGALARLEALVLVEPYREHRWWLLALARYRSGRRRDSLNAFVSARRALLAGPGLELGPDLARLEHLVLTDDPSLGDDAALVVASGGRPPQRRAERRPRGGASADGGAHDVAAAVAGLVRAGDEATAGLAFAEAAGHYQAAWRAAEEAGLEADELLLVRWGDALRRAGDPRGSDVVREVAERARARGDPRLLAEAALSLCQLGATSGAGGTDAAVEELVAAALDGAVAPALRARLLGAASLFHSMGGEPGRCRTELLAAVERARAVGDPRVLADVLPYAYLGLGAPHDLELRAAAVEELRRLGAALRDPITAFEGEHLRFSTSLQRGELDDARAAHEAMRALAPATGEPGRRWAVAYQEAALAHLGGELDRAEAQAEAALHIAERLAPDRARATYYGQLFGIRADDGRLGELEPFVAVLVVDQPGLGAWRAALAQVAAAQGELDRAAELVDGLLGRDGALAEDFLWSAAMGALGRAAAAIGEPTRCERVLVELSPLAGRLTWEGTCSFGPVDTVLGLLLRATGRIDGATARASTALRLAERIGAPRWAADAATVLGRGRAGPA